MDKGPPIPLFAGERVIGSWPAYYLYSVPLQRVWGGAERYFLPPEPYPEPPGRLAVAYNWLRTERRWAVRGELHLTDWRLVFTATPHWTHRLIGHLSLFLLRLVSPPGPRPTVGLPARSYMELLHAGSPKGFDRRHGFVTHERACLTLEQRMDEASRRPPVMREAFEEAVAGAWWRAGLGLLSERTRASLPGPFSTGAEGETYRARGAEPPDFELLRMHLQGIAGEGLQQLPWLFAPPEPLRPAGPWTSPMPPRPVAGRPLRVGGGARQSERRRGGGWS